MASDLGNAQMDVILNLGKFDAALAQIEADSKRVLSGLEAQFKNLSKSLTIVPNVQNVANLQGLQSTIDGLKKSFEDLQKAVPKTPIRIPPDPATTALNAQIKTLATEIASVRSAYIAGAKSQADFVRETAIAKAAVLALGQGLDSSSASLLKINQAAATAERGLAGARGEASKLGLASQVSIGILNAKTQALINLNPAAGSALQSMTDLRTAGFSPAAVAALGLAGALVKLEPALRSAALEFTKTEATAKLFGSAVKKSGVDSGEADQLVKDLAEKFKVLPSVVQESTTQLLRNGASLEQVKQLLEGAGASALAYGKTAASGFENVTQATVSLTSAQLNQIGISENIAPALDKYAKSLGKTSDQLTRAEQTAGVANLVLKATGDELEGLPTLLAGYAGALGEAEKANNKLSIAIGERVAPAITAVTKQQAAFVTSIADFVRSSGQLEGAVAATSAAVLTLAGAAGIGALKAAIASIPSVAAVASGSLAALGTALLPAVAIAGVVGITATVVALNSEIAKTNQYIADQEQAWQKLEQRAGVSGAAARVAGARADLVQLRSELESIEKEAARIARERPKPGVSEQDRTAQLLADSGFSDRYKALQLEIRTTEGALKAYEQQLAAARVESAKVAQQTTAQQKAQEDLRKSLEEQIKLLARGDVFNETTSTKQIDALIKRYKDAGGDVAAFKIELEQLRNEWREQERAQEQAAKTQTQQAERLERERKALEERRAALLAQIDAENKLKALRANISDTTNERLAVLVKEAKADEERARRLIASAKTQEQLGNAENLRANALERLGILQSEVNDRVKQGAEKLKALQKELEGVTGAAVAYNKSLQTNERLAQQTISNIERQQGRFTSLQDAVTKLGASLTGDILKILQERFPAAIEGVARAFDEDLKTLTEQFQSLDEDGLRRVLKTAAKTGDLISYAAALKVMEERAAGVREQAESAADALAEFNREANAFRVPATDSTAFLNSRLDGLAGNIEDLDKTTPDLLRVGLILADLDAIIADPTADQAVKARAEKIKLLALSYEAWGLAIQNVPVKDLDQNSFFDSRLDGLKDNIESLDKVVAEGERAALIIKDLDDIIADPRTPAALKTRAAVLRDQAQAYLENARAAGQAAAAYQGFDPTKTSGSGRLSQGALTNAFSASLSSDFNQVQQALVGVNEQLAAAANAPKLYSPDEVEKLKAYAAVLEARLQKILAKVNAEAAAATDELRRLYDFSDSRDRTAGRSPVDPARAANDNTNQDLQAQIAEATANLTGDALQKRLLEIADKIKQGGFVVYSETLKQLDAALKLSRQQLVDAWQKTLQEITAAGGTLDARDIQGQRELGVLDSLLGNLLEDFRNGKLTAKEFYARVSELQDRAKVAGVEISRAFATSVQNTLKEFDKLQAAIPNAIANGLPIAPQGIGAPPTSQTPKSQARERIDQIAELQRALAQDNAILTDPEKIQDNILLLEEYQIELESLLEKYPEFGFIINPILERVADNLEAARLRQERFSQATGEGIDQLANDIATLESILGDSSSSSEEFAAAIEYINDQLANNDNLTEDARTKLLLLRDALVVGKTAADNFAESIGNAFFVSTDDSNASAGIRDALNATQDLEDAVQGGLLTRERANALLEGSIEYLKEIRDNESLSLEIRLQAAKALERQLELQAKLNGLTKRRDDDPQKGITVQGGSKSGDNANTQAAQDTDKLVEDTSTQLQALENGFVSLEQYKASYEAAKKALFDIINNENLSLEVRNQAAAQLIRLTDANNAYYTGLVKGAPAQKDNAAELELQNKLIDGGIRLTEKLASTFGNLLVNSIKKSGAGVQAAVSSLVSGVQSVISTLARGDWVGAIVAGVSSVIDSVVSLFNGAAKSVEDFENRAEGFRFINLSSRQQSRGWLADLLGGQETVTRLNEFGLQIAQTIENGIGSALQSGFKDFLNSKGGILVALQSGLRNAIQDAIIQATLQGAIVKGAIGKLLEDLSAAIASGADTSSIVRQIAAQIPGTAAELEKVLTPLREVIDNALPDPNRVVGQFSNSINTDVNLNLPPMLQVSVSTPLLEAANSLGSHVTAFGSYVQEFGVVLQRGVVIDVNTPNGNFSSSTGGLQP